MLRVEQSRVRLADLAEGVTYRIRTGRRTVHIEYAGRRAGSVRLGVAHQGTGTPLDGEWLSLEALDPDHRYVLRRRSDCVELHEADTRWRPVAPGGVPRQRTGAPEFGPVHR